jgi:hypothetical protein
MFTEATVPDTGVVRFASARLCWARMRVAWSSSRVAWSPSMVAAVGTDPVPPPPPPEVLPVAAVPLWEALPVGVVAPELPLVLAAAERAEARVVSSLATAF